MKRIGLTASKIAKGNIWLYHLAVVVISFLFAMFVFLVCGFCIAVALVIVSLVLQRMLPNMDQNAWSHVVRSCLKLLGILIGVVMLVAIVKNIKLNSKL